MDWGQPSVRISVLAATRATSPDCAGSSGMRYRLDSLRLLDKIKTVASVLVAAKWAAVVWLGDVLAGSAGSGVLVTTLCIRTQTGS
mmetsp:Transcript_2033/g.3178  ORF Transcript_2033/g.3178 Transcript_2033/m.3178 type:complete len:86 (+) Transcript_2033:1040-1297(+)